jgi:hypothetical protein
MKPLACWKGTLEEEPDYYGPKSFCSDAISHFPVLTQDLVADTGLHILVAKLAEVGRSALEAENVAFLDRLFAFLESVLSLQKLHPEIKNALIISFLLPVDFERSAVGRQVWRTMPERLKHVLEQAI